MQNDVISWYVENRPTYKLLAGKVEVLLSELFDSNDISYHMISSRAKTIESVKDKVAGDKYDNPKEQIQDFSGIRIITYVEDEIESICKIIEDIFEIDEDNSANKSDALGIDKVGYKSVHYVASLDKRRLELPEYHKYKNKCFEIQVRTILQHAWAEIEHDRNYKFSGKLPPDLGRRFKILAGVLEMADREFNSISNEIDGISKETAKSTAEGNFNIPLSSTTLSRYISSRFSTLWEDGYKLIPDKDGKIISEMEDYGIKTLEDFNRLIPSEFEESLRALPDLTINESALVLRVLIINDFDKYFTEVSDEEYWVWTGPDPEQIASEIDFFKKFGVDWEVIHQKYGASLAPY